MYVRLLTVIMLQNKYKYNMVWEIHYIDNTNVENKKNSTNTNNLILNATSGNSRI